MAVIALISALYAVLGTVSGLLLGPALRGYPAHFFRGLTMSMTAAYSRRMWSTTIMGAISGLIFLAIVPAPAPYLLIASLSAGLIYDLTTRIGGSYAESSRRSRRIAVATILSGVGESVVALTLLTYFGLFKVTPTVLAIIWVSAVAANIVISLAGASITLLLLRRYR